MSYFADPISDDDVSILKITKGSSVDQQVCESLAMLVGLRLWSGSWKLSRSRLLVKGDSVTALTLVLHCRGTTGSMGVIAREIALDIAESVYRPDLGVHIPGVMNVLADKLSRLHSPTPSELPACLAQIPRVSPPLVP